MTGHDSTRNLKLAIERLLQESPYLDLMPKSLWKTLLTKQDDKNYKIKSIQGHGEKKTVTFNCGNEFYYHRAQAHIKNVIVWYETASIINQSSPAL